MRFWIKLGILLNIIGFSGLFVWDLELKKESKKIERAKRELPSDEDVLEFFLNKYKRTWSAENKQKFLNAIRVTSKHYKIDKFDLMTVVALESNYKIAPRPRHNSDGTVDYGLTQQNSKYYRGRYKIVAGIAERYSLPYNINDKFDISLNVLSCGFFLNQLRNEIRANEGYVTDFQFVASYNTGVNGFYYKQRKAREYYSTFQKLKLSSYDA